MTDDIVTRLRDNASHLRRIGYTADGDEIAEAADEIERLRAFVLTFPCTCWINKPKCVRCEVKESTK
jgi:hypothetical protein